MHYAGSMKTAATHPWVEGVTGTAGLIGVGVCALVTAHGQGPAPQSSNPMDPPLRLLAEARGSYKEIKDYACLFIKRERIRGQLQPENLIQLKVRSQPFSVYMQWQ